MCFQSRSLAFWRPAIYVSDDGHICVVNIAGHQHVGTGLAYNKSLTKSLRLDSMFLRWRKMSCLDWRAVTVLGARTRRATTRGRTSVGSCTAQRGARGGLPAGEPAIEKGLSQKTHQARRTCGRTSKTPTWVSICSQGGPEGLLLRVLQSQDNSTCSIDHLARCVSCGREFGGCRGLSAVHSGVLF